MIDFQWNIPWQLQAQFPSLEKIVEFIVIPLEHRPDKLMWCDSKFGDIPLKNAYHIKDHPTQKIH